MIILSLAQWRYNFLRNMIHLVAVYEINAVFEEVGTFPTPDSEKCTWTAL